MNKLYVLGMGPGSTDYILPITTRLIESCEVLVGGNRHLQGYLTGDKILIPIGRDLETAIELAKGYAKNKNVAFLLSGDTGFYSMLNYIKTKFRGEELQVVPGISSLQYMAASIGESWHDAFVGSGHGRNIDLLEVLSKYNKIFLLTDGKFSPREVARTIIQNKYPDRRMFVGERLSYEDEKITMGTPEEIVKMGEFDMAVVVIKHEVGV